MASPSFSTKDIYGGGTPKLAGEFVIDNMDFAVYPKTKEDRMPRTFAAITFRDAETGEEHLINYSVGRQLDVLPGDDTETIAKGTGDQGPKGKFLVLTEQGKKNDWHFSERYNDTFPKFWKSLEVAGVPDELLRQVGVNGASVIEGIKINLAHEVREYTVNYTDDKGEDKESKREAVFNHAIAGSYVAAKGKAAAKAPKPAGAAAAKAAPKGNGAASADDETVALIYSGTLDLVIAKLSEGEAVDRVAASMLANDANNALGDDKLPMMPQLAVAQGVKGTGAKAGAFTAALETKNQELAANGMTLALDAKGAFSLGEAS